MAKGSKAGGNMRMAKGPQKRPGGQGTGHLSAGAVASFSQAPNMKPMHMGGRGGGGSGKKC